MRVPKTALYRGAQRRLAGSRKQYRASLRAYREEQGRAHPDPYMSGWLSGYLSSDESRMKADYTYVRVLRRIGAAFVQ